MQFLLFLFVYPALWLISILPFRLLYILSDGLYLVVYRLIGYRKKTVRRNIRMALPHLSASDRLEIERKSYHHLCDMFLEMIKTMSMSRADMDAHFSFTNPEFFHEMQRKGKSIIVYCAHYATYEWIISMNYHIEHKGYAVYKRIRNPHFDKLVRSIRSRFGAELLTTKETVPTIVRNRAQGITAAYGLVSDQSPKASSIQHWTRFMGMETPVHVGAELLAKRYDMIVMNLKVTSVRRGFYEATFELMSENPREVANFGLTDDFMNRLEQQILRAPEFYLWTHKRWKHQRKDVA